MDRLNFLSRSGSSANKAEKATKNANESAQTEPIPTIEEGRENENEEGEGETKTEPKTGAVDVNPQNGDDEAKAEPPAEAHVAVAAGGEEAKTEAEGETQMEGEVKVEADDEAEAKVEGEANVEGEGAEAEEAAAETEIDFEAIFRRVCDEVDEFVESLPAARESPDPPDVPECFEKFNRLIEEEIDKYEAEREPGKWCLAEPTTTAVDDEDSSSSSSSSSLFVEAITRASRLAEELSRFPTGSKYGAAIDRATATLQRAMSFLEEEFRSLLEEGTHHAADQEAPETAPPSTTAVAAALVTAKTRKLTSFVFTQEQQQDRAAGPVNESDNNNNNRTRDSDTPAAYAAETTTRLSMIAALMISAGYASECCHVYGVIRRWVLEDSLTKLGLDKFSIDEVQKMSWETLESEIATWAKACKRCAGVYFPDERSLCERVFPSDKDIREGLASAVARGVVIQLLNFAEAVVMTKRSVEKLFKFLDVHEAVRDLLMPVVEELFVGETLSELRMEAENIRSRLGEAAVGSFSDLENSIKADTGKTPVPGGAVHPLTRYVMNYLKYACGEYKETMEQVFQDHNKVETTYAEVLEDDRTPKSSSSSTSAAATRIMNATPPRSPFVVQLSAVMDLLDSCLEAKSKLYKDPPLSYIFLMNNGRYIIQKIKESSEMHALLGDNRKRSSELRQYHKNYTRETWSKLLACLRHDGLMQGKGTINKPALKERFKSFNALFEEIHKTQSGWLVSDEQLQSELRVSIAAVMVPAYRAFLGRFQQYLDPGRQTEKYIKFGPEELESFIDELFDGTPVTMARKR
ncbi:hypothetical protein H6P81_009550 [Aristolochia fimbriata]|uniref:Exocyst subunit Exo70 family protein n=1 Tax=Aristolochia fimbriata TaxID=158543 RepID=A0AAV7EL86_ARIFI|nr:hypothetical protein H6P81_009550 [Aristolochia fimbriata]